MTISIAMATYNGEAYLEAQLQSLLTQKRQPDELVITDDKSTDSTLEIIRRFAADAPFNVRYSQNDETLGYRGNFSRALSLTTGDLVFLCDQDDVWFPEKISTIERLAAEDGVALVFMNDAELTDGALKPTGLTKLAQHRSAGLSSETFVTGCCAAVRRDLLNLVLPVPGDYTAGHDDWIVGFAAGMGRRRIEPAVLQYYRRHGKNTSVSVVNALSRARGYKSLLVDVRQTITDWKREPFQERLGRQAVFLSGVERGLEKGEEKYRETLELLRQEVLHEIDVLKRRRRIRYEPLPRRLWTAARFWASGNYEAGLGFRSFIRDIAGTGRSPES